MGRFTLIVLLGLTIFGSLVLSACGSILTPQPSAGYERGDLLEEVDFNHEYDWEEYTNPDQKVDFRIENGAYRATAHDGGFMWTLNVQTHTDVLIQVDTLQFSTYRDNAYGVMCRASADNNSDGYYFMISADGQYTIRRGFNDEIQALIEWTPTSAIHQDNAANRIRVLCLGERLALYINDTFVGETHDALYRRGNVGITAAVPDGGEVDIQFDNMMIWNASAP